MLMRIADHVDNGNSVIREWFLKSHQEILDMLAAEQDKERAEKERSNNNAMLTRSIDAYMYIYIHVHVHVYTVYTCTLCIISMLVHDGI